MPVIGSVCRVKGGGWMCWDEPPAWGEYEDRLGDRHTLFGENDVLVVIGRASPVYPRHGGLLWFVPVLSARVGHCWIRKDALTGV